MEKNKGGRPKGSGEIARKVRVSFIYALKLYQEKYGKSFPEALCDAFAADPLATLKAIAPFCPKDVVVDKTVTVTHHVAEELPLDDIRARAEAVERRLN